MPNHGGTYHDTFGTEISQQSYSGVGAFAIQQVVTTFTVPSGSTLYAPTLLPSDDARYEVFTAYHNFSPNGMVREWGVYDHQTNSFISSATKIINSTFLSTYTSGGYYTTAIQRYTSPTEWRVYLWNYSDGNWEQIVSGSNDAGDSRNTGWDMFEEYLASCSGTIPQIESKGLQVYTSSGWQNVTSSYGTQLIGTDDFGVQFPHCGSSNYSTSWINQYYNWTIDPSY